MEPETPSASRFRVRAGLLLVGLVATLGMVAVHFQLREASTPVEAPSETPAGALRISGQYYVWVSSLEVAPLRADGGAWDLDDSAPDPYFQIWWKGVRVERGFAPAVDALIGNWLALADGLLDKARRILKTEAPGSGDVRAPVVRITPGGAVEVRIYDDDLGPDDPMGQHSIPFAHLREGLNVFSPPPGDPSAVQRLELKVVRRDQSAAALWRQLGPGGGDARP